MDDADVAQPGDRAGRTARELARELAGRLDRAGVPSPDADARWLLEGVTGIDPLRTPERPVADASREVLERAVVRREAREPLQLILGEADLRGLRIRCAPGVFIPRPETEIVAGVAIDAARASSRRPRRLLDVCTGTGAIACCLVAEVEDAEVVAIDRDPAAVELARENLRRVVAGEAGVAGVAAGSHLEVREGDLLAPVDPAWQGEADVLVSNPPYLPARDREGWEPEVRDHDPAAALIGGDDGHEIVDRLLHLAATWLRPGGTVVVEIDDRRGDDARAAAHEAGLVDVEVVEDLTGRPRCVVARRPR